MPTEAARLGTTPRRQRLFRLDFPQFPRGHDERAEPAECGTAREQGEPAGQPDALQLELAAVETRDPANRSAQYTDDYRDDHARRESARDAIPDAVVEERPPDERVAAADELG